MSNAIANGILKQSLAAVAKLTKLRESKDYDILTHIISSLTAAAERSLMLFEAFWKEAFQLIQMDFVAVAVAELVLSFISAEEDITPGTEHEYKFLLPCFEFILPIAHNDESNREFILAHVLCRCANPIVAEAMVPSFPEILSLFEAFKDEDHTDPNGSFGRCVSIISNLACCENVLPQLRELNLTDIVTPLLHDAVPIMRIFGITCNS
jgi:hypothetical protein